VLRAVLAVKKQHNMYDVYGNINTAQYKHETTRKQSP